MAVGDNATHEMLPREGDDCVLRTRLLQRVCRERNGTGGYLEQRRGDRGRVRREVSGDEEIFIVAIRWKAASVGAARLVAAPSHVHRTKVGCGRLACWVEVARDDHYEYVPPGEAIGVRGCEPGLACDV